MIRVLTVDDDHSMLDITKIFLEKSGDMEVECLGSAKEALKKLKEDGHYDVIVSDYAMPKMNGISFLKKVRVFNPDIPFIILTGKSREEVVIDALNNGANYYLQKDANPKMLYAELAHHIREATDKEKLRRAVLESEKKYRTLFENMNECFSLCELVRDAQNRPIDFVVKEVNSQVKLMMGLETQDVIGKRGTEISLSEIPPSLHVFSNVVEAGSSARFETYLASVDRYFLMSAFPAGDGQFATIFSDITEHKKMDDELRAANEELKNSYKKLQDIIEFLPDATFVIDQDRKVVAWNRAVEEMTGIPKKKMIGKDGYAHGKVFYGTRRPTLADLVFSSDDKIESFYQHVKRKGDTIFAECIISPPRGIKGAYVWSTATPLLDEDGNVVGAIESIRDITEMVETEMALQESEDRMRLIIEAADLGTWDRNVVTGEVVRNKRLVEILGYPEDELAGFVREGEKMIHPNDFGRVITTLRDHLEKKTPYYEADYRLKRKDGRWIWVHDRGEVTDRDEMDHPVRMLGVTQDVTAFWQSQEAIREANRKLNLLSNVTRHDILSQIVGLWGCIELMNGNLPKECAVMQENIDRATAMAEMIHRQIVFTRDYQDMGIEAPQWQSVEEVVRRSVETVPAEIAQNQIRLDISAGTLQIFADPMLGKVFFNLIDNAVRHGNGVTKIQVSFIERQGEGVIVVEDDGSGIPKDMKTQIFDHGFGRHNGFGLFLCREILGITRMTIAENGEDGNGARFEIAVPKENYRLA